MTIPQARARFCVFHGLAGTYHTDLRKEEVSEPLARAHDRGRALAIFAKTFLATVLAFGAFLFLTR